MFAIIIYCYSDKIHILNMPRQASDNNNDNNNNDNYNVGDSLCNKRGPGKPVITNTRSGVIATAHFTSMEIKDANDTNFDGGADDKRGKNPKNCKKFLQCIVAERRGGRVEEEAADGACHHQRHIPRLLE